jgi:predicted MPP superfamily phosphohydrolase
MNESFTPKHTLLHKALVFAYKISCMPTPMLLLVLGGLVGSAAWVWMDATQDIVLGSLAGIGLAVFIAGDWVMLAWLPRKRRSFGPVAMPLLALAGLRWALSVAVALVPATPQWTLALLAIGNLALTGNVLDSLWAEPFRLGLTRIEIESPKWVGNPPLRVLHLADLHIERITARDRNVLALVKELRPDLIVFTGDFLNLSYLDDPRAQADCREFLCQLQAPLGVYAVTGSPSVDPPHVVDKLLDGLALRRLHNKVEPIVVSPGEEPALEIVGITCTHDTRVDGKAFKRAMAGVPNNPSMPFTLLLYHSPDLMPQARRAGVDLYLCGHTHGGQIRLPLIGALVTSSKFWKRYEMGRYVEANTTLYVSRGIGMEGMGAPRARFLCPPEIELFEIRGPEREK